MKRIRLLTIIFSIIFAFFITAFPASAADDMMDNLLPQETKKKQEGDVKLEYNEYPLARYGMETKLEESDFSDVFNWSDGAAKQGYSMLALMNSTMWGINKIIAATVGTIVQESFNFDIINEFADDISKVVQTVAGFGPAGFKSSGLWPFLVTFIIVLVGSWAGYIYVVKRSANGAVSGILSCIIILALALGFFTNSDKILRGINTATSEVHQDILNLAMPGSYEDGEGVASVRNQIFNLMVKYPYLLLNFGTTDEEKVQSEWKKSGSRVDAILKTKVISTERMDAIKYEVDELGNQNMKPQALGDRFVILIFVSIMNGFLGVILLLLAASGVFYQILALVYTTFTPLAFLVGLIPAFSKTATNMITKVVHAFYMKLALGFVMTSYFVIAKMVYSAMNPTHGYLFLFAFQIICAVAVWVKRHEVMNILTTPFSNVNSHIGQSVNDYKQAYFTGKKHFNKVTSPFTKPVAPLAERTRFNELKVNPGIGVVNPLKHHMFAPVERKGKNGVSASSKSSMAGKRVVLVRNEKTTAPVERKQQPLQGNTATQQVGAAPATASIKQEQKNLRTQEPVLNERRNLESLESTIDKGSWAHITKEDVQIKDKDDPILVDRLAERKAAAGDSKGSDK